jgi:outer membrane protein assembly factor BamB
MTHALKLFLVVLSLALAGCSSISNMFDDDEVPLEGERISVLDLEKSLEPDDAVLDEQGFVAPAPWKNEFWPQSGGYPNHAMQNLALGAGPLQKAWQASIGQGSTNELPLTAQPIVVDGLIYAIDTDAALSAFDINSGKLVWRTDVADPEEDDPVIGGGISFAGGVLYVTNGYDELLTLDPRSGTIKWRKRLPAPSRAAPTIMDGRIFVTTLDNRLLALDANTGTLLWEHIGLSETATLVGAASPAATADIVVPVFSSGEMTALRVENGSVAWSDNLSNFKHFGGISAISDIRALPVVDNGLAIGISFSGRIVAIDERTGNRVWQREIGGPNTPWLAGNHLFVLTADNNLVALGRDNGAIRWVTKIKGKDNKPMFFTGPILAGGRLILAGTDGDVVEVNPETGQILGQWDAGATVAIAPVVAGGTLYLLTEDGTLTAYR